MNHNTMKLSGTHSSGVKPPRIIGTTHMNRPTLLRMICNVVYSYINIL
jgi:hypothetical protein